MNLALFVLAIVVSFIVVRIGAIAFQMTGLEWSLARFQSLSCRMPEEGSRQQDENTDKPSAG